jgi:molybdenum cofactor guanylyltransferase
MTPEWGGAAEGDTSREGSTPPTPQGTTPGAMTPAAAIAGAGSAEGADLGPQGAAPSWPLMVIVLAGGRSRRFGADKLDAALEGEGLLDRCLRELPLDVGIIVVGPPRTLGRPVLFVREDPPYGGPAAAVAAGLRAALASPAATFAVLPGDAPFAGRTLAPLLAALNPDVHVTVGTDPDGVEQPVMVALDRLGARAWLEAAGEAEGAAARAVLHRLTVSIARVSLPADHLRDIDTKADLAFLASESRRRRTRRF